jgi:hypothetical protein
MRADTGSSHEKSDHDCIGIRLAAFFGYDGEDIGELLLEKIGSIFMVRSSGMGLWTGAQLLDRTGKQSKRELLCILGDKIEKGEGSDLVWCGRGCVGILL